MMLQNFILVNMSYIHNGRTVYVEKSFKHEASMYLWTISQETSLPVHQEWLTEFSFGS